MKPLPLWTPRRPSSRLTMTVVLPVMLLGIVSFMTHRATELPSDAAVRVDGVVVTQATLQQRIKVLRGLYGIRPPSDPNMENQFMRDSAASIAESIVIDKAAQARHIRISDRQARQGLENIISHLNPPGESSFIQLLQDTRVSERDVVDEIERQDREAEIYRQVTASAVGSVTDLSISNYFTLHQKEMIIPEQRHLRNIVVASQPEATQIISELHAGADFAAEANQNSLDDATTSSGGDLGYVAAAQLDDSYARASFTAADGSVFGPVQTPDGWNIGQVLEIRPQVQQKLVQVHDQIADELRQQRADQAWRNWISEQFSQAKIQYAPGYQPPRLPATTPSSTNASTPFAPTSTGFK